MAGRTYARVSTDDQDLTLQRAALKAAGCKRLYGEKVSGAKRDLLEIAEQLKDGGAGLRSLAEPWADTTSLVGKMVLTVFAGIAEFERALIHQRTSTGRLAAKARGVRFGRPSKLTPEQVGLGRRLVEEGSSVRQVARVILRCHSATLYRELAKVTSVEGNATSAG